MHTRRLGRIGEDIACKFLENKGFRVICRNYSKKWGEIDIVAIKTSGSSKGVSRGLDFFEVKSTTFTADRTSEARSRDLYRPEENVNAFKVKQIRRMIQTYLIEQGRGPEEEFHFHVLAVFMDMDSRRARVKWLKDMIL